MYKIIIKITGMLILAAAIMTSAASAQDGGGLAPLGWYTGVETAKGTCEAASGMCYGNSFVLNSNGEWDSHHLSISVDYSEINLFARNNFAVMGGSWSLVVLRENAYVGTLYGKVSGGNVLLTPNNAGDGIKETQLNLSVTGGMGAFAGKSSYQEITGEYRAETNLDSGETSGNAVFSF